MISLNFVLGQCHADTSWTYHAWHDTNNTYHSYVHDRTCISHRCILYSCVLLVHLHIFLRILFSVYTFALLMAGWNCMVRSCTWFEPATKHLGNCFAAPSWALLKVAHVAGVVGLSELQSVLSTCSIFQCLRLQQDSRHPWQLCPKKLHCECWMRERLAHCALLSWRIMLDHLMKDVERHLCHFHSLSTQAGTANVIIQGLIRSLLGVAISNFDSHCGNYM